MPGNPALEELGSEAAFLMRFLKLHGIRVQKLASAMLRTVSDDEIKVGQGLRIPQQKQVEGSQDSGLRARGFWAYISVQATSAPLAILSIALSMHNMDGRFTAAALQHDKNEEQHPSSCNLITAL